MPLTRLTSWLIVLQLLPLLSALLVVQPLHFLIFQLLPYVYKFFTTTILALVLLMSLNGNNIETYFKILGSTTRNTLAYISIACTHNTIDLHTFDTCIHRLYEIQIKLLYSLLL